MVKFNHNSIMTTRPVRQCNLIPPNYCDEKTIAAYDKPQTKPRIETGERVFVSVAGKGECVRCASSFLDKSPYFSLLFEVNTGPIEIVRDFELFKKVIRFAKYPGWRLRLLHSSELIEELDFYAVIESQELEGLIAIRSHIQSRDIIIETMYSMNFSRSSGFVNEFEKTLSRVDISSNAKSNILDLLVSKAWKHLNAYAPYKDLCQEYFHQLPHLVARTELIAWFLNPV